MDRIDVINGREHTTPAATQWDLETVIEGEDVYLLMYIV